MTIRRYRPSDFDAVVALWDALGFNVPPNDPARDIPFLIRHSNAVFFVDEDGGEIVGTVMGGHDGIRGWFYRLGVAPRVRHQGRARALLQEIERWLAARGIVKVQLMIRGRQPELEAVYRRLGYEVSDRTLMARLLTDEDRAAGTPKIPVVITYLEMTSKPAHEPVPRPAGQLALLRAHDMPVAMYRYFYRAVGGPWFWWERCRMADDAIASIIHDPRVELYLFHVDGCPAGYVEIDRRAGNVVNINHMGLLPEFIGRKLGQYLLRQSIETAWITDPAKVTVDTCTLDHPAALRSYQRAGFTPYAQRRIEIDDPRVTGDIPEEFEPNLPV